MKLILAAVFALIATATFAGDGRYAIAEGKSAAESRPIIWVLDTKTGVLRYCFAILVGADKILECSDKVDASE